MKVYLGETKIVDSVQKAETFTQRFFGLMFKRNIEPEQGLLINNCNWVHTFFMMQSIDLVYMDKDNKIIALESGVKPWRLCKPRWRARSVLELSSGTILSNSLRSGEVLRCFD